MRLLECLVAAAVSCGVVSVGFADVTGKVTLNGKAPAMKDIDMSGVKECAAQHPDPVQEETVVVDGKGNLANVVVSIKTDDPGSLGGEVPKTPAVLDQKGCMYSPHVLPIMIGQEFLVKNSDGFLHNIQSLAQVNPAFNIPQANKNAGQKVESPKAVETYKIKCQVHPWMGAYIVVVDNPFFAVTKEDGTFDIKGLPDGDYTLKFWHEAYGEHDEKISVKGGNATVNYAYTAK